MLVKLHYLDIIPCCPNVVLMPLVRNWSVYSHENEPVWCPTFTTLRPTYSYAFYAHAHLVSREMQRENASAPKVTCSTFKFLLCVQTSDLTGRLRVLTNCRGNHSIKNVDRSFTVPPPFCCDRRLWTPRLTSWSIEGTGRKGGWSTSAETLSKTFRRCLTASWNDHRNTRILFFLFFILF